MRGEMATTIMSDSDCLQNGKLHRRHLLARISVVLRPVVQVSTISNKLLLQLLLYGEEDLPSNVNKHVLQLTLEFIHRTGRFE